jgi:outer membrane lipoprotein SlyB
MRRKFGILLAVCGLSFGGHADDMTKDAAIGGGVGGAVGAAIGAEIADREGAIVGAALGAAAGTAIATDEYQPKVSAAPYADYTVVIRPESKYCPPGQAKKGRC